MSTSARTGASERWLPVAGMLLLGFGALAFAIDLGALIPPCLFRQFTGLYCPGCGSGRMLSALIRLDFHAAWRANPLALAALPAVFYGLVRDAGSAWGVAELPWPKVQHRWAWAALWVVLTFWVLRNVSIWPFWLLAPR